MTRTGTGVGYKRQEKTMRLFPLIFVLLSIMLLLISCTNSGLNCNGETTRVVLPELSGRILGPNHAPVGGISISPIIVNTKPLDPPRTVYTTGPDGSFFIPCITAGKYSGLQLITQTAYRPTPRLLVTTEDGDKYLFWPNWDSTGLTSKISALETQSPTYASFGGGRTHAERYPDINEATHVPVAIPDWPIDSHGIQLQIPHLQNHNEATTGAIQ